jgi:TonB-linked SusC/RagA family outer membrane protein
MLKRLATCLAFFFLCATVAHGQDALTVEGTVTDAVNGDPLPGTNVVLQGTNTGTTTDSEGQYTLQVPDGEGTLVFSFVGYQTRRVQIRGRSEINVSLEPGITAEEVVVTGYGGTQTEKSLTGSVASIKSQELTQTNATTVSDALVGKIAGINARKPSGRPGASTQIQIRNMGDPLYVIDGVPKDEGQFNNLDYSDIEDITILKDASAASIYGVRASNGVVLVTTKTGEEGQDIRVNFDAYYGVQQWTRFPEPASAATFYWANAQSDVNNTGTTSRTQEEFQNWQEGAEGFEGTNWKDFATQEMPAPQSYFNVSASGGIENASFYASVSRLAEEAVFTNFNARGAPFNRTNFQLNLEATPVDRLTMSARLNARIEQTQNPGLPGVDDLWRPMWGILQQWPTFQPYANGNRNFPQTTNRINSQHATLTYENSGVYFSDWRVAQPQVQMEFEIIEGFTASGTYAYYYANQNESTFEYTYDTYDYNEETETFEVTGGNANPYRDKEDQNIEEHNIQTRLNFDRTLSEVHNLSADAAFEFNDRHVYGTFLKSTPPTNEIKLINFDDLDRMDDYDSEQKRMGVALRANYNFDDRYLVEVAGRYDGSYKFSPGERWGLFPSASVGWRISNEPFYEGTALAEVLTELKIRASHGQTGSDDFNGKAPGDGIGDFRYLTGYNFNADARSVFNGQPVTSLVPRDRPEANISWLESTMTNIGLDFGLWDGQLSGSIDGFYRERDGLLATRFDVLVPVEADVTVGRENLNSDANIGLEGALEYSGTVGEVQYTVGGNATYSRRRATDIYKPRFANSWDEYRNAAEGRWTGLNWGYQVIGQFQSKEEIDNYPVDIDGQDNNTLLPGDFKYRDFNGDGVINQYDQRPIGYSPNFAENPSPIFSFGFNGSVQWKGADLNFTFAGASGQSYNRNFEIRYPFQANGNSPEYLFNDAWHRENPFDQSSTEWDSGKYPPIRQGASAHSSYASSSFWMTNITYVRLENLEVGYTIPDAALNVMGARNLRVYVRGTNLFSIDNAREFDIDPESTGRGPAGSNNNGSGIQYPKTQEFTVGVNLSF